MSADTGTTASASVRLLLWNLEWTLTSQDRYPIISRFLSSADADVMCLTEVNIDAMPSRGFTAFSEADYGYQNDGNRRKVALWSREKWCDVDSVGDAGLPPGRLVSGISHGILFIGVCIPWRDAHVRTGNRNRSPWEDHISYLKSLRSIVQKKSLAPLPLVVLGDFNQRIPRSGQPPEVARMLAEVFGDSMCIHTSGIKDDAGRPLIDHVAASPSMGVHVERFLPKTAENGLHLTDHSGIVAVIHERS